MGAHTLVLNNNRTDYGILADMIRQRGGLDAIIVNTAALASSTRDLFFHTLCG
jgi:hypothetical protein